MPNSWTDDRRGRAYRRALGMDVELSKLARGRQALGYCSQGEYARAWDVSPYTVMRRERLDVLDVEAGLALRWCLARGRLPTVEEWAGIDELRDGFAYRAHRLALGLSVSGLALELGIRRETVARREGEAGRGRIGREAAAALLMIGERVRQRRQTTVDAMQGTVRRALDEATE